MREKLKTRKGMKFLGELPKVIIQAPMIEISDHSAKCTGCGNVVHCLDLQTVICPLCAYEQSKEEK